LFFSIRGKVTKNGSWYCCFTSFHKKRYSVKKTEEKEDVIQNERERKKEREKERREEEKAKHTR